MESGGWIALRMVRRRLCQGLGCLEPTNAVPTSAGILGRDLHNLTSPLPFFSHSLVLPASDIPKPKRKHRQQ